MPKYFFIKECGKGDQIKCSKRWYYEWSLWFTKLSYKKLFAKASELFLTKWNNQTVPKQGSKNELESFPDYFKRSYLDKTNRWALTFSPLCPSTNNGLESTNGIIKEQKTLRERLPTNVFLAKMKDIAFNWSKRRDSDSINCIHFDAFPFIELDKWTRGFHLAIDESKVFICKVILFNMK